LPSDIYPLSKGIVGDVVKGGQSGRILEFDETNWELLAEGTDGKLPGVGVEVVCGLSIGE
jgi:hypothetical protein